MTGPFPLTQSFEIHADRMKTARWSAGGIALTLTFVWVAVGGDGIAGGKVATTATIVAMGGAALSALGTMLLCMRYLARRGPMVVIDANGIYDRRIAPQPIPWARICDLRPLDEWGFRIAVDVDGEIVPANDNIHASWRWLRPGRKSPPIINTFFLRTTRGSRLLDLLLPITEIAPIDFADRTPQPETLVEDARRVRRWLRMGVAYLAFAVIFPATASAYLVLNLT